MTGRFTRFARATAHWVGHPVTFALAVAVVLVWLVSGPFLGFSDSWQLWINTATTISTGLIVFLIQSSQNADTAEIKAMLRQLIEDLPDVDERQAMARAQEEQP